MSNKEIINLIKKEVKTVKEIEKINNDIIKYFLNKIDLYILNKKVKNITLNILSDIEEIRLDILKNRYETGSYYTPEKKVNEIIDEIEIIKEKTYMDTSCGSGNFLIEILNRFSNNNDYETFINFLENKIYGFDINEEAINIFKTRIYLIIIEKYNQEYDISKLENIKIMDFLLNDENIKADIIIGNPPYLGVKSIEKEYALKLKNKYKFIDDLYAMFISKSLDILSNDGELYLITSNTWITISSKVYIREKLIQNGLYKIIENDKNTFNIKTNTSILFLKKCKEEKEIIYINENTKEETKIKKETLKKENNYMILVDNENETTKLYNSISKDIHSTNSLKKFTKTEKFKELLLLEEIPLGSICYIATGVDFKGKNKEILFDNGKKYNKIENIKEIKEKIDKAEFKEGINCGKYIKAVKNEENIYVKWDKETVKYLKEIKAPLRNLDLYGKELIYCNTTKLSFRKIDENTICVNSAGACFLKPVFDNNYEEIKEIIFNYLINNNFMSYLKKINNGLSFSANDIKKIPIKTELIKDLI